MFRILKYSIGGALLGSLGYHYGEKYLESKTNLFLDDNQIRELRVRNKTNIGDQILNGHPSNQYLKIKAQVVIVGGGIIGATQALSLLERGYNVTILENGPEAGTQCSAYNGNIFNAYGFIPVVTLNFFEIPEESTIRLNPNVINEKNFFQFAFNGLLLSMSDEAQIYNSRNQVRLGTMTLQEIEKLKNSGLFENGHFRARGHLSFFLDEGHMNSYTSKLSILGVPFQIFNKFQEVETYSKTSLQTRENRKLFDKYGKAIVIPTDTNIETNDLTLDVVKYCEKNFKGQFQIYYNKNVTRFVVNNEGVKGLVVQDKENRSQVVLADKVVLCMAHKTKDLAIKLGIRLPIIPGKGWAMGIPFNKIKDFTILKNFTLNTPNFAASSTRDQFRLSGGIELCKDEKSGIPPSQEWGSKMALKRFNEQSGYNLQMKDFHVSSCYRPLTPDDFPIISTVPNYPNVFINAGHGARGTSYCFGSAEAMTQVIEGSKDFEDYNLSRFYFI